jgi:hypothetical protein
MQIAPNGTTCDLCLEGLYFECPLGHTMSLLRLSWAISALQEKCRKEATVVPNYMPSIQSLIIHHSTLIYPFKAQGNVYISLPNPDKAEGKVCISLPHPDKAQCNVCSSLPNTDKHQGNVCVS